MKKSRGTIRKLFEEVGLSQARVAELLDMTPRQVSDWLRSEDREESLPLTTCRMRMIDSRLRRGGEFSLARSFRLACARNGATAFIPASRRKCW
jgi:predicted transcriptional regulator